MAVQRDIEATLRLKDSLSKNIHKANKSLRSLNKQVERNQKELKKIGKSVGFLNLAKSIIGANVAMRAFSAVFRTVRDELTSMIDASSRAVEVQNLFSVSFGDMADAAEEWASRTSAAIGVNDTTLKEMSGTLFNMVSAMGISKDAAFDMSTGFTQLALDAASFFNLPFDQAFNKIRSGISGETEPLKQLGILVTENAMKQLDWVKAIDASGRKLTEQEKVIARAQLIQEGLANAQGDLIRTQDSWANATRLVIEAWTDFREEIGRAITENETIAIVISFVRDKIKELTLEIKGSAKGFQEFVSGGVKLAIMAMEALVKTMGLLITGLGKVGQGLVWLDDKLGLASKDFLEMETAFVDGMVEFGESLLSAGANIDLLQEQIDLAEKGLTKSRAASREAADGFSGVGSSAGKALIDIDNLKRSVQGSGKAFDGVLPMVRRFGREILDVIPHVDTLGVEIETVAPIIERLNLGINQLTPGMRSVGGAANETAEEVDHFNEILQQSANLTIIFGQSLGSLIGSLAGAASGFKSLFGGGKGLSGFLRGFQTETDEGLFKTTIGSFIGGFAKALPAIGAIAGPLVSLFGKLFKPKWKKLADEVARDWGVNISEGLAKAMEATAERLDLGRFEARLLHLSDVMAEVGVGGAEGVAKFSAEVINLMNSVELGAVPAAEGIAEIGKSFSMLAEESLKTGDIVDAGILQMIVRARELGQEIPEIADFIAASLARAAGGLGKIGGIQILTAEDAAAQATIVTATFFATMAEQGLLAAADAMRPAWEALKESLAAAGMDVAIPGMDRLMQIASEDAFRPLLEGVAGLNEALIGLSNAGYMTSDSFSAFQQQGISAFEQLKAAGLTEQEALLQMAPMLQNLQEAAAAYGMSLDPATQSLIDQAEAAGIAFKTEPMQQMVDVMKLVAEALGVSRERLDEIGGSAATAGQAMDDSFQGAAESIGGSAESMQMAFGEAFEELGATAEDASVAAQENMQMLADKTSLVAEEMGGSLEKFADITELSAISASDSLDIFIERAREAAKAVGDIPEIPNGGAGGGAGELPGFQHGGFVPARPPYGVPIRVGEREGEFVIPESRMGGGGTSINVTMPISVSVGGDVSGAGSPIGPQIQAEMDKWLRNNRSGFRGAIVRTAERG